MADTRDIKNIRARLERWELTHLRALAATLHDQLEAAERQAQNADISAEFWQANAMQLQDDLVQALGGDAAPGITVAGDLVVTANSTDTITPPAPGQVWPEKRGVYLGIAPAEGNLPARHLVSLTDHASPARMDWADAMRYANALGDGARLPTQLEAMIAFTLAKASFKPNWHWTSTQGSSDTAFVQSFESGNSGWTNKAIECFVVPVRGFALHTFTPLTLETEGGAL